MRFLKVALVFAGLVANCGFAQAAFTSSVSGTENLVIGEVGSFNFHVDYSPIDVGSLDSVGGLVYYKNTAAWLVYPVLNIYSITNEILTHISGAALDLGGQSINFGGPAFSDFSPSSRDFSFSQAFDTAGTYLIAASSPTFEEIYRQTTDYCRSLNYCSPVLNDSTRFQGRTTGYMLVNVSAVPEPETYALFAMGLGILTFSVRRRKLALSNQPK